MTMNQAQQAIDPQESRLALEIATGLRDPKAILRDAAANGFDISRCKTQRFQNAVADARERWNSVDSIEERIREKGKTAVEDSILDMYSLVKDESVNPSVRIDAFTRLVKLADMEPKPAAKDGTSGGRVFVNLNFGPKIEPIEVEATAVESSYGKDEVGRSLTDGT